MGTSATFMQWFRTAGGGAKATDGGFVGAASVVSEFAIIAGGLTASFYLGACIGSLIVATEKSIKENLTFEDFFKITDKYLIPNGKWLMDTLTRYPELLKAKDPQKSQTPILRSCHVSPRLMPSH